MEFLSSIGYPTMTIYIYADKHKFRCEKYTGGTKVQGALKECSNLSELEEFLFSLPSAPTEEINTLLKKVA